MPCDAMRCSEYIPSNESVAQQTLLEVDGLYSRANDTRGNAVWCLIQVPAPRQRMRCDDDAAVLVEER